VAKPSGDHTPLGGFVFFRGNEVIHGFACDFSNHLRRRCYLYVAVRAAYREANWPMDQRIRMTSPAIRLHRADAGTLANATITSAIQSVRSLHIVKAP
jgi:hypothetical protein